MVLHRHPGQAFRERVADGRILPLIGVYDVFSARLVGQRFDGVFCSGFGFAASAYGLPDIGFVNWRDIVDYSTRVRHVLPDHHVLVDIDDGFGDDAIAANTVRVLESNGISAVMMEDQKRPRRCGHFDGKEVLPLGEYLVKLRRVLETRRSLFVIARTDASDASVGIERAIAFAEAGADGVMVEAIKDLAVAAELVSKVNCPVMVNQLHGGKSPNWSLDELRKAGVSIVIYSTPCLFSAQYGIERYLDNMMAGGRLPDTGTVSMDQCSRVVNAGIVGS